MEILKGHETTLTKVARSAQGGIEWHVSCCGEFGKSFHVLRPGSYTQEELTRLRNDSMRSVAEEHQAHEAACQFVESHAVPTDECPGCK